MYQPHNLHLDVCYWHRDFAYELIHDHIAIPDLINERTKTESEITEEMKGIAKLTSISTASTKGGGLSSLDALGNSNCIRLSG